MDDALSDLFRDVVDLPAAERARYFEAHAIPQEIREHVESLIRFDTRRPFGLSASLGGAAAELLSDGNGLEAGARCGPYVLVRLIGRGGMGTVFLAERTDGELDQRVAIKFVPAAPVSAASRDRFLRERQILASLQHAGIAHLLDAGHTAAGQPYLVMEFVDGAPIDRYADALPLRRKLELFLDVCDAVAYAHRRLVVHRDIKPTNILVDASGRPRLLDFGIARMLDEAADDGVTRERLLTPEYASPEQVHGTARTTATDIYSLGAVLYRLIAGQSPHADAGGSGDVESNIRAREPAPPSRLEAAVPRDLDFVVLRALRKEPEERYPSVDAFAEDVRAVLSSHPVRARSGNAWYWTRKFVRRHWLPVSAAVAIVASLSAGVYVANRQRRIAERRFLQLRQLSTRLMAVDEAVRNLPGSMNARQQMVAASMEYLDGLGRETYQDRELMMELARGYVALAQVQGVPVRQNLGQSAAAVESLRKADAFLRPVLAADPTRPDALATASELEEDLMIIADTQRRDAEALAHTKRSGEYAEALFLGGRASAAQLHAALPRYVNVAVSYKNRHQLDEAARFAARGIELARRTSSTPELSTLLSIMADVRRLSGDVDGALPPILEARRLAEGYAHASDLIRSLTLYGILIREGQILGDERGLSLGRPDEAIEPFQAAFESMDRVAAQEPGDATSRDRVATTAIHLAAVVRLRDPKRALAVCDRAVQRARELKDAARAHRDEAGILAESSSALRSLGRYDEARQRVDRALDLLRATGDYPAASIAPDRETAAVLAARAELQADSGDVRHAVETYRELLDAVNTSRPDVENDLAAANDVARLELSFAEMLRRANRLDEANEMLKRRLELWTAWDRRLPGNTFVRRQLQAQP